MYKKGQAGDQIMFFVLFVGILIIGGALAGAVVMFYGGEIDSRETMAEVLNYKIRKCLIDNNVVFSENIDLFKVCSFKKEVMVGVMDIKICQNSFKMDDCINDNNPLYKFGSRFVQCGFTGRGDEFPRCSFDFFQLNGKNYGVLTVNNHFSKKVLG